MKKLTVSLDSLESGEQSRGVFLAILPRFGCFTWARRLVDRQKCLNSVNVSDERNRKEALGSCGPPLSREYAMSVFA